MAGYEIINGDSFNESGRDAAAATFAAVSAIKLKDVERQQHFCESTEVMRITRHSTAAQQHRENVLFLILIDQISLLGFAAWIR